MRPCRVPGCAGSTTRFSALCTLHKATTRRHGDPRQQGITKQDLRPYDRIIDAHVAKNGASQVWGVLEGRWLAVVDQGREILRAHSNGRAGPRHEIEAAAEVVKLGEAVKPWEVIRTALAMCVMLDQEPRRFRSDAAFAAQLVRRVRGLTDTSVGQWFDDKSGRLRRMYRELPPRASAVIHEWLVLVIGPVGGKIAALEREELQARQRAATSFLQAVRELV